jgi:hypothetical protein
MDQISDLMKLPENTPCKKEVSRGIQKDFQGLIRQLQTVHSPK